MIGAIAGALPMKLLDQLWIEMNEAEGDDENHEGAEAMSVVAAGDAFALVCHRHAIYVPANYVPHNKSGS